MSGQERYHGHARGVVVEQPSAGKFTERPMTDGELAARDVAAKIQDDIFRHANTAGACYFPIWLQIANAIDNALQEHKLTAQSFDLVTHLHRQREFSARTFGPGARVEGVTDHIAKELQEVKESGGALAEWVDVIILGLDGAWRSGATPEQIAAAIVAKQTRNEARTWPDWRTAAPGKAIEHDRSLDSAQ